MKFTLIRVIVGSVLLIVFAAVSNQLAPANNPVWYIIGGVWVVVIVFIVLIRKARQ